MAQAAIHADVLYYLCSDIDSNNNNYRNYKMKLAKLCVRCAYVICTNGYLFNCQKKEVANYVKGIKFLGFFRYVDCYEKNKDGKCKDYKYKGVK
jgi:hypothetical protein